MAILEVIFVVALGILLGLLLLNALNNQQQQRQLEDAFYRLLEIQNGQISLIQLTVAARVNAELAQQYLERQIQFFSASLEVDADGDTFYRFPKLRLPEKG